MSYAPATLVEGQPPTALPYGLFSVLAPRPVGDGRWQNGILWETLGCAPVSGIGDPSCDPDTDTVGLPKTFAGAGGVGEATPFTVYGSFVCSPVGHDIGYAQEQATARLLAFEEAAVERALWTGAFGAAGTGFAAGAASVGTGLSVKRAVAALEAWIGRTIGSLGVLHMSRDLATLAVAAAVVTVKGSSLFTALGTPVVAGAGYPGTGPDGDAPATDAGFMYATPALLGYRSEPFPGATPPEAGLDRRSNDLFAVTERTYVIGHDPCGGTAVAGVSLT